MFGVAKGQVLYAMERHRQNDGHNARGDASAREDNPPTNVAPVTSIGRGRVSRPSTSPGRARTSDPVDGHETSLF